MLLHNNVFIRLVLYLSRQVHHTYVHLKGSKSMFHFMHQISNIFTIRFILNQPYFHYCVCVCVCVCKMASRMCNMTKLWGGGVPTSVRDYYRLRLCRLWLCFYYPATYASLVPDFATTRGPPSNWEFPVSVLASSEYTLCTRSSSPMGVARLHPIISDSSLVCPHCPPPVPYCVLLSPRRLLLAVQRISSKVALSCVSATSWQHHESLLRHPPS